MKIIGNILLIILVVILQSTILSAVSFFGVFPNLILLIPLSLIFLDKAEEALLWAGLGGILLDLISPAHFGIYTLSLLVIYILTYYLVKYVFTSPSVVVAAGIFFVASLIFNLIFLFMTHNYISFFAEAIYSTFVGCIIYGLIRYYYRPREEVRI